MVRAVLAMRAALCAGICAIYIKGVLLFYDFYDKDYFDSSNRITEMILGYGRNPYFAGFLCFHDTGLVNRCNLLIAGFPSKVTGVSSLQFHRLANLQLLRSLMTRNQPRLYGRFILRYINRDRIVNINVYGNTLIRILSRCRC